jgi:hypothetical protein
MADDEGRIGYGVTFEFRTKGTSGAYTKIQLVTGVTVGGEEVGEVDWSHAESPNRLKQTKSGWLTPGQTSVKAHYTNAGFSAIGDVLEAGAPTQEIKVSLPVGPDGEDGFIQEFDAILKKRGDIEVNPTDDTTVQFSIDYKATSLMTTTPVTA